MRPEELLPRLLKAWPRVRHPRLGDAIDGLTALLEARPPLPATKKRADLDAWTKLEARGDVNDFPRLMAAARGGQQADVLRQAEALASRDDARFATGLLTLLEDPPYAGVASRPLLTALIKLLLATKDKRAAEPAWELASRYIGIVNSSTGALVVERLEALASSLDALPEPDLEGVALELCELAEQLAPPRRRLQRPKSSANFDALFELVTQSPDDDGPRRVLADALLESGDGRGEFIRKQLDGQPTDDTQADVARWLQPLKMAGAVTCERGFPSAVAVYKSAEKSSSLTQWRTVRSVSELQKLTIKGTVALLDSPQLKNLRDVRPITSDVLDVLAPAPRAWTKLHISNLPSPAANSLTRFTELEQLTLALGVAPPESLFTPTPRLTRLELSVASGTMPPALLTPLTSLRTLKVVGKSEGLRFPEALETVNLEGDVSDADFSRCTRLQSLRCSALALSASPKIPSLQRLHLSTNGETRGLEGLSGLKHLALSYSSTLAPGFLSPLRGLISLELAYAKNLTAAHLTGLEELVHLGGMWTTWSGLPALPHLRSFDCMAPSNSEPLAELLERAPNLEFLSLGWNSSSDLYFHDGPRFEAHEGWKQLSALLRNSRVRVLDFHESIAFVRDDGGPWRALLRARTPFAEKFAPQYIDRPLELMNA